MANNDKVVESAENSAQTPPESATPAVKLEDPQTNSFVPPFAASPDGVAAQRTVDKIFGDVVVGPAEKAEGKAVAAQPTDTARSVATVDVQTLKANSLSSMRERDGHPVLDVSFNDGKSRLRIQFDGEQAAKDGKAGKITYQSGRFENTPEVEINVAAMIGKDAASNIVGIEKHWSHPDGKPSLNFQLKDGSSASINYENEQSLSENKPYGTSRSDNRGRVTEERTLGGNTVEYKYGKDDLQRRVEKDSSGKLLKDQTGTEYKAERISSLTATLGQAMRDDERQGKSLGPNTVEAMNKLGGALGGLSQNELAAVAKHFGDDTKTQAGKSGLRMELKRDSAGEIVHARVVDLKTNKGSGFHLKPLELKLDTDAPTPYSKTFKFK